MCDVTHVTKTWKERTLAVRSDKLTCTWGALGRGVRECSDLLNNQRNRPEAVQHGEVMCCWSGVVLSD